MSCCRLCTARDWSGTQISRRCARPIPVRISIGRDCAVAVAMNFLLALSAIIIEFTLSGVVSLRTPHWSGAWAARCGLCDGLRLYRGWLGALLLIGLPVLAVELVGDWLMSWSHPLYYLLSLGLLVWMLGPTDLNREVEEYRRSLYWSAEERAAATPAFTTTTAGIDFGPPSGDARVRCVSR